MSEEYIQTLNDLIQQSAASWTNEDLFRIVQGFREQRDRWNDEQAAGSRKLVRSSSISAATATAIPKKPTNVRQVLKGLKL